MHLDFASPGIKTRMLISIVSRPFMNNINNIIKHMLFTDQLGDTKL